MTLTWYYALATLLLRRVLPLVASVLLLAYSLDDLQLVAR